MTNRAVLCAALARGRSRLTGVLQSDDTHVMLAGLQSIGLQIEKSPDGTTLDIAGGVPPVSRQRRELFVGNSGTTIRFLTAALSAIGGCYRLHGVPRMHARPIADLLQAINALGGNAVSETDNGCPPVMIDSQGWTHGEAHVSGAISSQYLSGLLMAAPAAARKVSLMVDGELVSKPYVEMTIRVMEAFGVEVQRPEPGTFAVAADVGYRGCDYEIEPDASAASYPFAAAAITGGEITVEGLSRNALQGDVRFCEVLERMGAEVEYLDSGIRVRGRAARGVDVDMNHISDTVQTLAVVALFAKGPTRIRGVAHNRHKETDRIGDLACELRRLGAAVEEFEDGLRIDPPEELTPTTIETYDDHRMAMSFALAGLRAEGIVIDNPACVAKTYPRFFADLELLTGQSHVWEGEEFGSKDIPSREERGDVELNR